MCTFFCFFYILAIGYQLVVFVTQNIYHNFDGSISCVVGGKLAVTQQLHNHTLSPFSTSGQ
jgi:hypothetical protein